MFLNLVILKNVPQDPKIPVFSWSVNSQRYWRLQQAGGYFSSFIAMFYYMPLQIYFVPSFETTLVTLKRFLFCVIYYMSD